MTPYYQDDWLTVWHGDCREAMAAMEPESVNCVVTSPPYWGLRDYGTATWVGGEESCDHKGEPFVSPSSTLAGYKIRTQRQPMGKTCRKCGAERVDGQLGLERTPEEYVANLVAVFREVRRVLRKDGTVWLNLGDCYASSPPGNLDYAASMAKSSGLAGAKSPKYQATLIAGHATKRNTIVGSLKPKDLVGIPWRVAFALQADGWYLRSDIIWSKPNPMPESVTDRPTKSHEYLFLLSKSARYFYDAEAVQQGAKYAGPNGAQHSPYGQGFTRGAATWAVRKAAGASTGSMINGQNAVHGAGLSHDLGSPGTRNIRSVWTIATEPYPGAHFATFPRKLVEPCIKAGCPEGGAVLDPFAGSGTTGLVAQSLSRRAVLIDLSLDYLGQLMTRNADIPLGLGS